MKEHRVLITEPPNNDNKIREELVELMFESCQVPKLYLGNSAVMSLFAKGLTTGTVIDAGYGKTHTVPIYEGFAIPHATTEVPICGQDLSEYMLEMIQQKGREKGSNHQWTMAEKDAAMNTAEMIKHNHCRVAADYDAELKAANEGGGFSYAYDLPDNT
jgi:actin, other eukaryote